MEKVLYIKKNSFFVWLKQFFLKKRLFYRATPIIYTTIFNSGHKRYPSGPIQKMYAKKSSKIFKNQEFYESLEI